MRSQEAIALDQWLRERQRDWTEEFIARDLAALAESNEKPIVIPPELSLPNVQEERFEGMQLFKLNMRSEKKLLVLYLHGGGYVHQPSPAQFAFLGKLVRLTDTKLLFPVYPKAPVHSFRETYPILLDLYRSLSRRYRDHKFVFMGDSSGAALALGLGLSLPEAKLPQPAEYILFSPFADMTLKNPQLKDYAEKEAMLDLRALRRWGESWAVGADPRDYRLSPALADPAPLSRVTLFTGDWELLHPDHLRFFEKLKIAGVPADLFIGEEMGHIYNVYSIPEADQALKELIAPRVIR